MSHIATHLAALALLFAAFFGAGAIIISVIPPPGVAREWNFLIRIVVGMTAWLTTLFVCAALGHLDRLPLVGAALAAAAVGVVVVWRQRRAHVAALRSFMSQLSAINPGLVALAAPLLVLVALFLICLTPYVGGDDGVYHLTLPRIYLAHRGFVRVPFNVYSNWPLNAELLYAFAMLVQDYILAKLIHLLFLGMTTFAVYRLASMHSSPVGGGMAVMLWLANPVVLAEAQVAYIDLAFAFFFFMAFVCALEYLERQRVMPLVLSGVCCGIVAGTKLTGVVAAPCIVLLVVVSRVASTNWSEWRHACRDAMVCVALPAALMAAPWYVRSYWFTGNPFYPLFYQTFGGPEWSSDLNRQLLEWQQSIGMGRHLIDYVLLPLRVAMYGRNDYAHFGARINPLWALLVPFSLVCARSSPLVRRSLATAALYFVFWAAVSQQARFLVPMLPLLAVAAGVALAITLEQSLTLRAAQMTAVIALAGVAFLWDTRHVIKDGAWAAREIVTRGVEVPADAMNDTEQFISERLPTDARLLFLNINRGFFIDRDYVADSFFEASQLNALVLQGDGGAPGISRRLRRMGITHVLVARRDWGIAYPEALPELLGNKGLTELIYTSTDGESRLFHVRGPIGPSIGE